MVCPGAAGGGTCGIIGGDMNIAERLHQLEDLAVDVLSVFGPWFAPVPSAYLVGRAAHNYLQWHWFIAIIAAVAVESIGVVSVILALRLYDWNETKNKTDPAAPLNLALVTVCVYFIVTIGLTVLLDVFPNLARYAPAIFPLLAAVGAVNIAIKNGQRRREEAKRVGKKRRQIGPSKTRHVERQDAGKIPADWRLLTAEQKRHMASYSRGERDAIMPELADRTRRAWNERLDKISKNGRP